MELEQLATGQKYSLTSGEDNNTPREKQERESPIQASNGGPWFYMFHHKAPAHIVYDIESKRWRHINLTVPPAPGRDRLFPVASSGGLICLRSNSNNLIVWNPLSGISRLIPPDFLKSEKPLAAISMHPCGNSYGITAVFGNEPNFLVKTFSQSENCWRELMMTRSTELKERENGNGGHTTEELLLQLRRLLERSIGGISRSHMMHCPPTKEFSGLATQSPQGHQIIHFLDATGLILACDTGERTTFIFPDIVPQRVRCSLDLVRCGSRILVVVLTEIMKTATVRVWEFIQAWRQVAAMPPVMSHVYYRKRADINCIGHDQDIMVCVTGSNFNQVVMCSLCDDSWVELPSYMSEHGIRKRFVCAHSFEPKIEAIP